MSDIINWENFAAYMGSATMSALVTQLVKKYVNIDPKWIALIISLMAMLGIQATIETVVTVESITTTILNALISAGASVGLYEASKGIARKLDKDGE